MRLTRGAREAGLALVVAAVVLLLFMLDGSSLLRGLETASLDLRFRLRGAKPPGPEVAVVLVDDRSLASLGRWPLSRHLFAQALRNLDRAGAKVIVFDLLFAEPEQPIPPALRDAARTAASDLGSDATLRAALTQLADDDPDGDLAAAIRASAKVLLPVAFTFGGPAGDEPERLSDSAYARFDKSPVAPVFPLTPTGAVMPVAALADAATGLGHVNIAYDRDGAPRYDYLALPFGGDFIPSIAVRAAAAFLGVPWSDVGLAPGTGVALGGRFVPTDRAMRLVVNYRGPRGNFPTYSFVDLVAGKVSDAALAGKIVLLGASFVGNSDSNAAPFGSTPMPGTERMANIVDTILQRDFIAEEPAPWPLIVMGAVLLLAAATGAATARLPTRTAAVAAILPIAVWAAAVQSAFALGLWLPLVQPLAALAAAMLAVLLFRYWVVDREGRTIQGAFRHYLAPDMVAMLAADPGRLKLGGETRAMTLLFCDIRGFTAISEQFKTNPQGLTQLINRFLTPMTDIIMARRGTIDKYMGDCVMAFWNAPLDNPAHADHACDSALAMISALEAINLQLEAEAQAQGRPFHLLKVGSGLNSGDCVGGNMGSDQRFDYSVLGDAVNLASRLEGQSKTYGVPIVIGEATRAAAPDWAALELDLIAVKGKRDAVRIYALLGDAATARAPEFASLVAAHARLLERYRAQDWVGARAALAECERRDDRLAALYALYAERIAYFETNAPGENWDGVFVATSK